MTASPSARMARFFGCACRSGRSIAYPFARNEAGTDKFDRPATVVHFMDNAGGKWVDARGGQGAWPGLWAENVVQAVARDLLAAAMMRLGPPALRSCFTCTTKSSPRCRTALAAIKNSCASSPNCRAGPTDCRSARRFAPGRGLSRWGRLRRSSRSRRRMKMMAARSN